MVEWGSEGHTRRQLHRSTPHHGQRCKLSHLDEVSERQYHEGIGTFFLWTSTISSLSSKTKRGHGMGVKKRTKVGFEFAKASTL